MESYQITNTIDFFNGKQGLKQKKNRFWFANYTVYDTTHQGRAKTMVWLATQLSGISYGYFKNI